MHAVVDLRAVLLKKIISFYLRMVPILSYVYSFRKTIWYVYIMFIWSLSSLFYFYITNCVRSISKGLQGNNKYNITIKIKFYFFQP